MSTSNLMRWSGLAVFLGAALWAVQRLGWTLFIGSLEPWDYPQPAATVLWLLGLGVSVLILLGLPALYAHQAEKARLLGLISFVVIFLGMALVTGNAYFGTFIQADLAELISAAEGAGLTVEEPTMAAVGFLVTLGLQVLGWFLFGLISLKAGVFPRWAAILVMVGYLPALLGIAIGLPWQVPLFETGLAWLGFALWREKGELLAEPATAT